MGAQIDHVSWVAPVAPATQTIPYQYTSFGQLSEDVHSETFLTYDDKRVLSLDNIEKFVTQDVVSLALRDQKVRDMANASRLILDGKAKLIFVILTMMNDLRLLEDFITAKVTDQHLPITWKADGTGYSEDESLIFPHCKTWSIPQRHLFKLYQAEVISPTFGDRDHFEVKTSNNRNLPFLKDENSSSQAPSSGFFGEVTMKLLHRAHIHERALPIFDTLGLLPENSAFMGVPVAIKEAKDVAEELRRFSEKEQENLKQRLQRDYKTSHLVEPIAAYQLNSKRYLVFPWADGGHLGKHWKESGVGKLGRSQVQWIIGQFVGIWDALHELHDSNCRHGDLKPDNILYFKSAKGGGTLQIADLGLAAFHDKDAHTEIRMGTFTPSGTRRYEPPEEDIRKEAIRRQTNKPRSRSYDVWSMGCTMLELLIWLMYGWEDLKRFRDRTNNYFWTYNKAPSKPLTYVLDPQVQACIATMQEHSALSKAYQQLLDLIKKRLLIIPYPQKREDTSPSLRATSNEAHQTMSDIYSNCKTNPEAYISSDSLRRSSRLAFAGVNYEQDGQLMVPRQHELRPRRGQSPSSSSGRFNSVDATTTSIPIVVHGTGDASFDWQPTETTSTRLRDNCHTNGKASNALLGIQKLNWRLGICH
ncbi:unnamed protein product [Clonostachys rhizophaga]|uniref:Protein kinase domain-containing protein n=1 Tax=Clonostachys rhizophaga TaxID=160324 RepID=A0A9N9YN51_9HYPO|nr:unnamed protein product [Clonostachys rhizophaga]